ncbi:MAG: BatD family protein [Planctomycetota bacterium]|jgi:hypothetical protein
MDRQRFLIILMFFGALLSANAVADDISLKIALEKNNVTVGEPFTMQIKVSGSQNPEKPDSSAIKDFSVKFIGGNANSSTSINVINGRMTKTVFEGYIFNYKLTALKEGVFTVPPVKVKVDGNIYATQPFNVRVSKPGKVTGFALQLKSSAESCYVGQPVVIDIVWHISRKVNDYIYSLPFLSDSRLSILPLNYDVNKYTRNELLKIEAGDYSFIGLQRNSQYQGVESLAITFKMAVIPEKSGDIDFGQSTVVCDIIEGYEQRQRRSIFDDPFFGRNRRAITKRLVVPADKFVLKVKDVPAAGKPANYNSHVGLFKLEASANPLEVNVGDPITLTFEISGSVLPGKTKPTLLHRQENLIKNFKVPQEIADGKYENGKIIFTQTIRALSDSVAEIPPLELPYFDAETGKYKIAKSNALPIKVHATRVVTSSDAEGLSGPAVKRGRELESRQKGIGYNYYGKDLLQSDDFRINEINNYLWLLVVVFAGPILYFAVFLITWISAKESSPELKRSRNAFTEFSVTIKGFINSSNQPSSEAVHKAIASYFSAKLMIPVADVFGDVEGLLKKKHVSEELLKKTADIYKQCEAAAFGGGTFDKEFFKKTQASFQKIEKELK